MRFGIKVLSGIFSDDIPENAKKLLDAFGGADEYFTQLSECFDAMEVSAIYHDTDPECILNAAKFCKKYGMYMTIHGHLSGVENAEDFFRPYLKLFEYDFQDMYNITVHPFDSPLETERILTDICDMTEKEAYPVRITLENQRFSSEERIHSLCRDVAEIVRRIGSKHLYNCFDFGHQLSNIRKFGEKFDAVTDTFLQQVRHTHIHSLFDGKTHFPLYCGEVLLEENLTGLLKCGFDDTCILELMPERYDERFDLKETIFGSLPILKNAVSQVKHKLEYADIYRDEYKARLSEAYEKLCSSDCGMMVCAPSSYVVKLGDTKIAVDPRTAELPISQEGRAELLKIVSACDAVIVTHEHSDHFDERLIRDLDGAVPVLLPDFLKTDIASMRVTNGTKLMIGQSELEFFDSAHMRNGSGVPEYGFSLKYNGGYHVFTADVRDYAKEHKTYQDTKLLVSHLWLGRKKALEVPDDEYVREFCDFNNSFGAERIYIGHLCDIYRPIEDMWSKYHFNAVKDHLQNAEPLFFGDCIEF